MVEYWHPMAMAALIILVFAYTIFVLSVTSANDGGKYPSRAYKEYRMEEYSDLFRTYAPELYHRIENDRCLRRSQICKTFAIQTSHLNASQISRMNLSPIQASCCREPSYCGFDDYPVKEGRCRYTVNLPRECKRYDQDKKHCHRCNSCIGALLSLVNKELRHFAFTNIWVTFLFSIYTFFTTNPTTNIFTRLHTAFPA